MVTGILEYVVGYKFLFATAYGKSRAFFLWAFKNPAKIQFSS
jgi:hypothetical protein